MLDPIAEPMANLLAAFYSIWPSYGGAIILLTTAVMLILTPLTYSGTKSMIKMQRLQPELKRIQKEYKGDRQQLNEEMMKFYKENQVNPLGGCLPLLLQMPIFIVLFQVLRGLTRTDPETGNFDPRYLEEDTALYKALSSTDEMLSFGFDLAISASEALSDSFVVALPYLAMILIVLVTGIVQQRQIAGRNPGAQVNPQQQMIMRIMPVFIAAISFTLQGALVIYFVVSNLFRVGQQWFITRSLYRDDDGAPIETTAREVDSEATADGSSGGLLGSFRELFEDARSQAAERAEEPAGKGKTAPKGRPTPARESRSSGGRSKQKGSNKRTTAPKSTSGGIAQPRPRKKKRR